MLPPAQLSESLPLDWDPVAANPAALVPEPQYIEHSFPKAQHHVQSTCLQHRHRYS